MLCRSVLRVASSPGLCPAFVRVACSMKSWDGHCWNDVKGGEKVERTWVD